jgi:S-adenosylmethionine:tRNA ribosyltransferase-isomerase
VKTSVATEPIAFDPLDFRLPSELETNVPTELRGIERDDIRMMVTTTSTGTHVDAHFRDLPDFLEAGDLVVVNTSATLPAALPGRHGGRGVRLHLSTQLPAGLWLAELREVDGSKSRTYRRGDPGDKVELPGGGAANLLERFPPDVHGAARLWVTSLDLPSPTLDYLDDHGRPITYDLTQARPLELYQTVYAIVPGSAEMPSAGRGFTHRTISALATKGVGIAPLVLHTGVSSLEMGEPPYEEYFDVPLRTARLVNATKEWGGRVIAVGTTVVRALESVASGGEAHPGRGWTDLVVDPSRPPRIVDGLITGWHEPRASHLSLIEAVAGRSVMTAAYLAAVERGYRWHEFGDIQTILP